MKTNLKRFFLGLTAAALILGAAPLFAAAENPQYGDALRVLSQYPYIPALSWDNYDWNWKHGHDTGLVVEYLMSGDLQKGPRGTNEFDFHGSAWWPPDVRGGELAESWKVEKEPLRIVFKLRKGVYFQEKPGVMKAREMTADDVVFNHMRLHESPKAHKTFTYYVDRFEALDKYTVAMYLKEWNASWWYHWTMGYRMGIQPKEMAEAGATQWQNLVGTGPYALESYDSGSAAVFVKNPNYWGKEIINGKEYQLPFTDSIRDLLIKDEATRISALRTAQVDLNMNISFRDMDNLKKTNPQLKFSQYLAPSPAILALRNDTKPFDDIRVRRAMNLAVNQKEILEKYWEGNAELIGYPFPASWDGHFTPLDQLPPDAQELFTYNPEKAKKLLAEAGYPDGFTFTTQVSSSTRTTMELGQLLAAYFARIGVTMNLEPLEYAAYLSKMTSKTHSAGYLLTNDHGNPQDVLRKNFRPGETWNPYIFDDPYFTKELDDVSTNIDVSEAEARERFKKLNVYIIGQAPAVWLPGQYQYAAWWPWVKNYYGEQRVTCARQGPIWARIWIDQELKKKMGY